MTVLLDVAPCNLVVIYQHFGRICCLLHQGRRQHRFLRNVGTYLPYWKAVTFI